jgi:hypothetical protein
MSMYLLAALVHAGMCVELLHVRCVVACSLLAALLHAAMRVPYCSSAP